MRIFYFCSVVCALLSISFGYRILGIFPSPSKSHYYVAHGLMKGLAEHGHDVTMISPIKAYKPIQNFTEVFIENSYDLYLKYTAKDNFMDYDPPNSIDRMLIFFKIKQNFTQWTFESQNFQNFLKTDQYFDVVIVEVCLMESFYGLMRHFDAPLIGLSPFGSSIITNNLVGTPNFASYIPSESAHYTDRMSFWERFHNSVTYWSGDLLISYYHMPFQQKMMEKYFPNATNWPSLVEIQKSTSLVLLNTHVTYGTPRPYAPNMIEVGGMQIQQKVEPLPEKLQHFLDEAENGAIFFSLGSNVLLNKLLQHQLDAIRNAFSDHSNIRILIKSNDTISIPSHKMEDVLVEPWFNQQSILAHPNLKLFITHGGLLSTTESVYFGKPMVGISVFFDQHFNMGIAEKNGYGIRVPLHELSTQKLKEAINNVLGNASYDKQAKLTSERYRDLLKNPVETAVFWVEHVAKNKGAPHLHSVAVDLTIYQLYNLDCWALAFVVLFLILFALTFLIKLSISLISSSAKLAKAKTS